MTTTKQRIISADSHVTEPGDLWVNYIEPAYRSRAPHIEHQSTTDIWVCDTGTMFPVGVMHGVRHKEGEVKVDGRWEEVPTSGYDPEARIPEIEMDGVGAEFLYPTVAMRFFTIEDVPFAEACLRAYNNWVMDFCKPYPDRFKACGVISLDNVENAVSEARRCKKLGLPGLMIALYPDESRPYHDPRYNPFWAVAEETGLPVSLHVATPRRVNDDVTETQMLTRNLLCPEVITGMIYAGVFDEFPGLKVVSAENDAGWAAISSSAWTISIPKHVRATFQRGGGSTRGFPASTGTTTSATPSCVTSAPCVPGTLSGSTTSCGLPISLTAIAPGPIPRRLSPSTCWSP